MLDYLAFRRVYRDDLQYRNHRYHDMKHSAKGSTWEEHKYIKRIDGTYYYPDSYEGGRHLPDSGKDSSDTKESPEETRREKLDLTGDDIERLAMEVIRGNFGNGQDRKDLLGENYQEIQDRVNQIMKSSGVSSQKMSSVSTDIIDTGKKVMEAAVNAVSKKEEKKTSDKKGIDLEEVYKVYNRR